MNVNKLKKLLNPNPDLLAEIYTNKKNLLLSKKGYCVSILDNMKKGYVLTNVKKEKIRVHLKFNRNLKSYMPRAIMDQSTSEYIWDMCRGLPESFPLFHGEKLSAYIFINKKKIELLNIKSTRQSDLSFSIKSKNYLKFIKDIEDFDYKIYFFIKEVSADRINAENKHLINQLPESYHRKNWEGIKKSILENESLLQTLKLRYSESLAYYISLKDKVIKTRLYFSNDSSKPISENDLNEISLSDILKKEKTLLKIYLTMKKLECLPFTVERLLNYYVNEDKIKAIHQETIKQLKIKG